MPSDVLITPASSKVEFTDGSNATKTLRITGTSFSFDSDLGIGITSPTSKLNVLSTTSLSSVFKAEGVNGTLFEVTDDLSNSLMSVNTIGGLPVFEVFANNTIVAGQYNANDFVISGNKVGIGIATPTTKLEVVGAIRGGLFSAGTTNSGEAWFGRASDRALGSYTLQFGGASASGTFFELIDRAWSKVIFAVSGEAPTNTFKITSVGNLGIGDGSPNNKLHVAGSASIGSSYNTTGPTNGLIVQGNVGIGTTNPISPLEIYKVPATSTTLQTMLTINTDFASASGTGFGGSITFKGRTAGNELQDNAQISAYNENTGDNGYALGFYTRPTVAGGLIQRMTILRGGNVGIGIINPTAILNVKTSTQPNREVFMGDSAAVSGVFRARLDDNSLSFISLENRDLAATTDHGVGIRFNLATSVSNNAINAGGIYLGKEQQWTATASTQDSYLAFATSLDGTANEKVRIKSDGNVGIGTNSPTQVLDVRGNIKLGADNEGNYIYYVRDNEGTIIRTARSDVTQVGLFRSDGWGNFTVDKSIGIGYSLGTGFASSTIGNGNLYVAGNVGIGTTNPSRKLHIKGTTQAITLEASYSGASGIIIGSQYTGTTECKGQIWFLNPDSGYGGALAFATQPNSSGTSAAERMRIGSDGNVGIGTSSPADKLEVDGGVRLRSGNSLTLRNATNDSSAAIYNVGGSNGSIISFAVGPTPTMYVGSNVGIGTISPTQKLDIVGSYAAAGDSSGILKIRGGATGADTQLNFGVSADGGYGWIQGTDVGATNNININLNPLGGNVGIGNTSPNNKLAVSGSVSIGSGYNTAAPTNGLIVEGSVGIGVTSPDANAKLHVYGNDAHKYIFYTDTAGSSSTIFQRNNTVESVVLTLANTRGPSVGTDRGTSLNLDLGYGGSSASAGTLARGAKISAFSSTSYTSTASTQNAYLAFYTALAGSLTEKMRIDSNGNVGIGTVSPSTTLHVNSTTSGATLLRADGTNGTLFSVVDDLSDSLMSVNNSAGLPVLEVFADDRVVMGQYGQNDFVLVNNKLGLGTNNPAYKLDINGTLNVSGNTSLSTISITGTITSSATEAIRINNNNGFVSFYNTAGSSRTGYLQGNTGTSVLLASENNAIIQFAIGGTIRATINANGNLGIGTTTPSAKLTIVDNVNGGTINLVGRTSDDTAAINFRATGDGSTYAYISPDTNEFRLYHNDGFMSFYPGGTEKWRITSAGVLQSNAAQTIQTSTGNLTLATAAGNGHIILSPHSNGNVGIGVATPSVKLEVQGNGQFGNDSVTTVGLRLTRLIGGTRTSEHTFHSANNSPWYTYGQNLTWTGELAGTVESSHAYRPYFEGFAPAGGYKTFGFMNVTSGSFTSANIIYGLTIQNDGNIGIGTASPAFKLDIVNAASTAIRIHNTANTNDAYLIARNTLGSTFFGINATGGYIYNSSAIPIMFYTSAVERVRIIADGNVGIGNSSPASLLHVGNSSAAVAMPTAIQMDNSYRNSVGVSTSLKFYLYRSGVESYGFGLNNGAGIEYHAGLSGNTSGNHAFYTDTNERMRIAGSGNVGIGVSTPLAKLHVSNVVVNPAAAAISGESKLVISGVDGTIDLLSQDDNSTVSNVIGMGRYHATTGALIHKFGIATWANTGSIGSNTGDRIGFHYGTNADSFNSTELLTIKANGNLGIGFTSPSNRLSVNGSASIGSNYNTAATTNGLIVEGNVGIGSSSPTQKLDVYSTNQDVARFYNNQTTFGLILGSTSNSSFVNLLWQTSTGNAQFFKNRSSSSWGGADSFNFYSSNGGFAFHPNGVANKVVISAGGDLTVNGSTSSNFIYPNGGVTGNDLYAQDIIVSAYHHGDSLRYDALQFNAPNTYETRATVGSSFVSTTVDTSIFKGDSFGGALLIPYGTYQVRWTWNDVGYRYFNLLYLGYSATAHSFTLLVEKSSDGVTWTQQYTSGSMGGWPSHGWYVAPWNNAGVTRLRITLTPTWDAGYPAYDINLYNMRYFCTYPLNGVNRLFDWDYSRNINFNGNIGIGVANPTAKLDIAGTNVNGYSLLLRSGDNYNQNDSVQIAFGFANQTNYRHSIRTRHNPAAPIGGVVGNNIDFYVWKRGTDAAADLGSQFVMTMQGDGAVGIGTTNPTNTLHIYSSANEPVLIQGTTAGTWLNFQSSTSNLMSIGADGTNGFAFYNRTSNSYLMMIRNNGNIGIGNITTSNNKLHVDGSMSVGSGYNTAAPTDGLIIQGSVGIGVTSASNTKLHVVADWVSGHSTVKIQTITSFASGGTAGIGLYDSNGTRSGYLYAYSTGTSVGSSNATSLIFETNGTEKMRILSGGNVGIGITAPTSKLNILSSTSLSSVFKAEGINGTLFEVTDDLSNSLMSVNTIGGLPVFEVFANNTIIAGQYNANDLVITGNKIGIGTATPSYKLQVNHSSGYGIVATDGTVSSGIYNGTPVGGVTGAYFGTISNHDAIFGSYGVSGGYVIVKNNGNVGIGLTSPSAKLEVSGTSGDNIPTFKITSTAAANTFNWAGTILNSSLGSSRNYILLIGKAASTKNSGYIGYNHSGTDGSNSNFLTFGHYSNDNLLNIIGDGNVGIGTVTPGYKLDVSGIARVGDAFYITTATTSDCKIEIGNGRSGNGNSYIDLVGDATYTDYGLRLIRSNGGPNTTSAIAHRGTGTLYITAVEAASIALETSNTTRVTINSSGNVGIGTTNPVAKLDTLGVRLGRDFSLANRATVRLDANGAAFPSDILFGHTTTANQDSWNGVYWSLSSRGTANSNRFYFYRGTGNPAPNNSEAVIMSFDPTLNVGIGFEAPTNRLSIAGSVSIGSGYNTAGPTNGLIVEGSVGIGITAPLQKFQVDGAVGNPATSGTTQNGIARLSNATDNAVLDFGIRAGGNGAWIQSTDETSLAVNYPLLLNPNGGSVGIGTISPTTSLDVAGTMRSQYIEGLNEYTFRGANRAINDWEYSGLTINPTYNSYDDGSWYIDAGNAQDWSRGILSIRRFRRVEGLTFEYEAYTQDNISVGVYCMTGFVDGTSTSYTYLQTPSHLTYQNGGNLSVFTNGASSGTSYDFDTRNAWWRFKTVLKSTGALHYVYRSGKWNLIVETSVNNQNDYEYCRILVSLNRQRIYFRDMKVYVAQQSYRGTNYIDTLGGRLIANGSVATGVGGKLTFIGLDINSGATPTYIKIITTIPSNSPSADFTVNIKGFSYGSQSAVDISICWHWYTNTFYNATAKSSGGWAPTIRLSAENGFVAIVLTSGVYWSKLYVESMYSSNYNNQYSTGWSWVDADATGNPIVTLAYRSHFGNNFIMYGDGTVTVKGSDNNSGKSDFSVDSGGTATMALSGQYFRVGDTDVNWAMKMQANGYLAAYGQQFDIATVAGAHAITFATNNIERMRITGVGSVGVGTTNPTARLDVAGGGLSVSGWSNNNSGSVGGVEIGFDGSQGIFQVYDRVNNVYKPSFWNASYLMFYLSGVEKARLNSSGNFGIGFTSTINNKLAVQGSASIGSGFNVAAPTNGLIVEGTVGIGLTNPNYKLTVSTSSTLGFSLVTNNSTTGGPQIDLYDSGRSEETVISSTDGTTVGSYIASYTNHPLLFGAYASVTPTAKMVIAQSGNVGVGIVSPSARLHLNSTTSGATLLRADGTNGTLFSVVDDLSDSLMSVNNSAGLPVLEVFADDRVVAGQYGANDFVLVNNKLGLGTNNPQYELDIVGPGTGGSVNIISRIRSTASSNIFDTASVIAFTNTTTNTNAYSYIGSRIDLGGAGDNAQALVFATNATNTLPTEKMRIKSDGNVGIGTNSPVGKLDVRAGSGGEIIFGTYDANYVVKIQSGDQLNFYNGASPNPGYINYGGGATVLSQNLHVEKATGGTTGLVRIKADGKVGIGTTSPAALLQVGTGTPTASTSGIQFGDDTSARIYRDSSTIIKVTGGFQSVTYIQAGNYLQTVGNLIYPAGFSSTQRLEVGNAAQNAWITGISIAPGGNVVIAGYLNAGGQTLNGQSFYQWEGATYRNPADHTPQFLLREDNSSTGINGFAPALALYNNNGGNQTTVGMVFVSAEAVSPTQGNAVNLAGIIAKKESAGTAGAWSRGSLNFFVKDFGTKVDALTIQYTGNVGIGTSNPATLLQVGTATPTAATGGIQFGDDTAARIYRVSPSTIQVSNNLTVGGTLTESSSIRYKENIKTVSAPILSKLEGIRPVTYNKKDNVNNTEYGIIAEELNEIFPEFVNKNDNGEIESVNYSRLTVLLIKAVKELKQEIEILKNK